MKQARYQCMPSTVGGIQVAGKDGKTHKQSYCIEGVTDKITAQDAYVIAIDLLKALALLRENNMCHGDIKPANIFFQVGSGAGSGSAKMMEVQDQVEGQDDTEKTTQKASCPIYTTIGDYDGQRQMTTTVSIINEHERYETFTIVDRTTAYLSRALVQHSKLHADYMTRFPGDYKKVPKDIQQ